MASVPVIGMTLNSPLSRPMSRVPLSWSMMPAAMKSDALKVAWFMMWKTAATAAIGLFMPSSSVISPRWLMVEYASSPLRSLWNIAAYAPSISVMAPVPPTSQNHSSVPENTGQSRAIRNTPALTMVAECR